MAALHRLWRNPLAYQPGESREQTTTLGAWVEAERRLLAGGSTLSPEFVAWLERFSGGRW